MSSWHYQVMKHNEDVEQYYAVHEYYHLRDGDVWTKDPVKVTAESLEDLKKSLLSMLNDLERYGVIGFK